jgi:hypothetical protein
VEILAIETIIAQTLNFVEGKYFIDESPKKVPQNELIEEIPKAIKPKNIITIPVIIIPKSDMPGSCSFSVVISEFVNDK